MTETKLDWLLTEGQSILQAEVTAGWQPSAKLEAWQESLLTEQRALRQRARRRFPEPTNWLWTDRSLAQASDWWTACYKASLLPKDVPVVDACCGAGADAVALAKSHPVTGIDSDAQVLRLAAANMAAHGREAEFIAREFTSSFATQERWLHIDPDRRPKSASLPARTLVADEFSPPIREVLPAAAGYGGALVKLAPKTDFSPDELAVLNREAMRVWVGNLGECRQQLALFGQTRFQVDADWTPDQGRRAAVLAEPNPAAPGLEFQPTVFLATVDAEVDCMDEVQGFVYDLHAVLHASDLQAAWAGHCTSLSALHSPQGYFTSDDSIESPWMQRFQVLDVVAWDDRKVRRTLRGLKAGIVEVKNRLIRLDANRYQRKYSSSPGVPLALLVTRLGNRVKAIVARRCPANSLES